MRSADNESCYFMYNGHGDVTILLNIDGTTGAAYYYDAFGNILEESGDADNPIRYAGYQYDEETGLYYLNARYYDSKIARFLSEDTYRGQADDPLSLNLYTYCFNNPIRYWDPTGHYVSEWDRSHLTESEIKQLEYITNNWTAANAAGNTKGSDSTTYWHDQAEKIRDKYRENNEKGTGDGHTVATANPSPSQTITYSAPLDGQNSKKDSNNVQSSQETNNNNSNRTKSDEIRTKENDTNLIMGNTTIAAPRPWEITIPALGISLKELVPALIPFVIFWQNPIICDDGTEASDTVEEAKKTPPPSKLKDGDKVKTPDTHPDEFKKNKDGSYTHKDTGWQFKKDKSGHRGDHYDAKPKDGQYGDYQNVSKDGKVL